MNKMLFVIVLVVVGLNLTACELLSQALMAPAEMSPTPDELGRLLNANLAQTRLPLTPVMVLTALPMQPVPGATATDSDFQFVERPVTVTPLVVNEIDWNEQLTINGWEELPGLYPNVKLYYNQSAVGKTQTIENIEVKPGSELVFGAVAADIKVKDLETDETVALSRSGGVYGTIPEGMFVVKMTIVDGFMAMIAASDAQNEFCARVAQAVAERWALTTTFPNPFWVEPICSGTYKIPVDSDRLHGGSLPFLPTP